MSWLLALVTGALRAGLGGAVSGEMTNLTAVVALLALSTVTAHVTVAATGVAGLTTLLTSVATLLVATVASLLVSTGTSFWAVARDVADLGALDGMSFCKGLSRKT